RAVLADRLGVVDRVGWVVDVGDGDVDGGGVDVAGFAGGAVVADRVGEAVGAVVVGVGGVGHAQAVAGDGHRAVAAVGLADDRQAGIERRAQVVSIALFPYTTLFRSRAVLADRLGVVDRVGWVV